ncbi:glycosyl hydrolase 108 family protein [Sphingorhabdus sp. Alg239-R122]|uniref:glycoside hydrolase family 108 protein n=1 Tax=Sphingorhabdus sp. Alg239-R122 TaxID=2305989 RepID=UPI0013DBDCEE|nr:glycosyl hydrolase 108 family protein [Sphingorhabdus sp. Alg239-R122]
MDIYKLIDEVIDREGGYSNHPADRGGETNWGITHRVARTNGFYGPMRQLSRSKAADIYRHIYWDDPSFNMVAAQAPALAAELFDTAVNMGPATASAFLQRALNVLNRNERDYNDILVDRQIGPRTLAALDAFITTRGAQAESILLKAVEALQGAKYLRLAEKRPANEAFLYGWLANRIGN